MAFRLRALASVAWMLLQATGCPRNVYDLRIEPSPKGLVRTLSVWREGEPRPTSSDDVKPDKQLEAEQLQRIGTLYPERVTGEAEIHQTFRGTFKGRLPADVGGSGTYEACDSPLGSGHWYIERFRGSDDFDAQIYDRRAAADRLTDLMLGWFDEQLKNSAQREAVHRWLHQDFRQDLRNVALFLSVAPQWQDRGDDTDNLSPFRIPDEHPLLRVLQYAVEKGYVEASETIPLINHDQGGDSILRLVRRKLGIVCKLSPAEAEKEFAFIAPTKELEESWKTYLRTTPEYARLVTAAKKAKKPADETPDPLKVLEELVTPSLTGIVSDGADAVRIQLKLPIRPFAYNGEFDADESIVVWRRWLNPADHGTPLVCMAFWAVPNESFQSKHFGKISLTGETLAAFAAQYHTLPAAARDEFAKHLASLEPGDALRGRARDFALVGPADEATKATVERLCDLLAGNL